MREIERNENRERERVAGKRGPGGSVKERETQRRRRGIGKIRPDLPVAELGDAGETRERR
jgi:hypothetical protein